MFVARRKQESRATRMAAQLPSQQTGYGMTSGVAPSPYGSTYGPSPSCVYVVPPQPVRAAYSPGHGIHGGAAVVVTSTTAQPAQPGAYGAAYGFNSNVYAPTKVVHVDSYTTQTYR